MKTQIYRSVRKPDTGAYVDPVLIREYPTPDLGHDFMSSLISKTYPESGQFKYEMYFGGMCNKVITSDDFFKANEPLES